MSQAKIGKKQSQETIDKRKKSFIPFNKIKIYYYNILFESITEASRITKFSISSIRRWVKSDNHQEWKLDYATKS